MDKLHYSDLSGKTQYNISELCKKYGIPTDELENLVIETATDLREDAYNEGYNEGEDAGDDRGYERGMEEAESDHYQDESMIPSGEVEQREKEAYYNGYRKGYLTGIDWNTPEFEDLKGY